MTEPQSSHDRQLTPSEKETLHRLFPRKVSLNYAYFKSPGSTELFQHSISSPEYFKELVSRCTSPDNLTQIWKDEWSPEESLPLFGYDINGELAMESSDRPGESLALSLIMLLNLAESHLEMQLLHESSSVVEQKTTSTEQLNRITYLLRDYGA